MAASTRAGCQCFRTCGIDGEASENVSVLVVVGDAGRTGEAACVVAEEAAESVLASLGSCVGVTGIVPRAKLNNNTEKTEKEEDDWKFVSKRQIGGRMMEGRSP